MTVAAHPYLKPEQFADRTFLHVRRQVARLRLLSADGELADLLRQTIAVYDDLIGDKTPARA